MSTPHTFPTIVDAAKRLDIYIAQSEYPEHYQYEISAVFDTERKVTGFTIRVKDIDGFGIGYVGPDVSPLSSSEKSDRVVNALHDLRREYRAGGHVHAANSVNKVLLEIEVETAVKLYDIIRGL